MQTLLDFLPRIRQLGDREAIRSSDGFRTTVWSYRKLYGQIGAVVEAIRARELARGDRVLLWGENSAEWVAAFWGCLACGIEVVPMDHQSSPERIERTAGEAHARNLIHGRKVEAGSTSLDRLSFDAIRDATPVDEFPTAEISAADVVDILYTSGTTGDPRGVVHRHRNICATLDPVQREIDRYIRWARPFQPIRILDLLPMSHVFGQAMGLFAPVMLGGSVVFTTELHPKAITETIRRERVTVLVAVPRLVDSLRSRTERRFGDRDTPSGGGVTGIVRRLWLHRKVHAEFGWKFWAFLTGGAFLDPKLEAFWSRRGFLVMQGYGMTETSAVVAINHPFRSRRGTLGEILGGQEVRIAPDGEILVRGDNVVSEYIGREGPSPAVDAEGWLHTGDMGSLDDEGRLIYRGRKKDLIVTAEGHNVHPDDVETVLNAFGEVRESVVVGQQDERGEHVHAVLIPEDPHADLARVVERANRQLETHQQIRSWSVWPADDFPRTPSSLKVRRSEVARALARPHTEGGTETPVGVEGILGELAGPRGGRITDQTRLSEDIGLSSLERVDLLSALEDTYQLDLEESGLTSAATVGELKRWIEAERGRAPITGTSPVGPPAPEQTRRSRARRWQIRPRWTRRLPFRAVRRVLRAGIFLPLFRHYIPLSVDGVGHLDGLRPPVIFAANHTSQLDTMAVLAALPAAWRGHVAPAMSQEYFRAYLGPPGAPWAERVVKGMQFIAAVAVFNAYPLPHSMGNIRESLRYTAELVDAGFCPLVYPEGRRSPDGRLQPFRPGIGLMALRLKIPIVPICIDGMFEVMPPHASWPKSGPVTVTFGKPVHPGPGSDEHSITSEVEQHVRRIRERAAVIPTATNQ